MKNSQVGSIDIMIAIVIFIGVIFIFYSILSGNPGTKAVELQDEALKVLKNTETVDSSLGIVDGIIINATKLEEILGKDYSEIKNNIRIKNEFCIYFEDENGNLIEIKEGSYGIGSADIELQGQSCGEGLSASEKIICEEAEKVAACGTIESDFGITQQRCCNFGGYCCP